MTTPYDDERKPFLTHPAVAGASTQQPTIKPSSFRGPTGLPGQTTASLGDLFARATMTIRGNKLYKFSTYCTASLIPIYMLYNGWLPFASSSFWFLFFFTLLFNNVSAAEKARLGSDALDRRFGPVVGLWLDVFWRCARFCGCVWAAAALAAVVRMIPASWSLFG